MDNDNDPHQIIFDPQNNQGNEAFVPPGFDEESSSEEEDENEEQWLADLQRIREMIVLVRRNYPGADCIVISKI
eukprot:scaffold3521_cov151-Skeletonema_dohrnii-CCMP3373.AAC.10